MGSLRFVSGCWAGSLAVACLAVLTAGILSAASGEAAAGRGDSSQAGPGGYGSQGPAGSVEVGVEERLGSVVPAGLTLYDEEGRPAELGRLVDKPTILSLNYFRCAGVCTPQLHGLARALDSMRLEPGRGFQVMTVSFDERDTPELARVKRGNHLKLLHRPFPASAWRFLTGRAAQTAALSDAVGFKFKAWGTEFVHPAVLVVLSPGRVVTRYVYGVEFVPAELDSASADAASGKALPSVTRALRYCFSFDPEGRRYLVLVTRLVGAFSVVMIALVVWLALRSGGGRAGGRGPSRGPAAPGAPGPGAAGRLS